MTMAWIFSLVVFVVIAQVFQATVVNSQKETKLKCENGGIPVGDKCICSGNVHGTSCDLVYDRVFVGKEMNAAVTVELPVSGIDCTPDLKDETSLLHQSINRTLTDMVGAVIPQYFRGIKITDCRKVSNTTFIVHNLNMVISFSEETVAEQYENNYKEVEKILKTLTRCDDSYTPTFCVNGTDLKAMKNFIPTEKDICLSQVNILLADYFDDVVEKDGLYCLSHCELNSPKRVNCNKGTCQIKKDGAQCFCPETDKYLYTYSRCRGAVLTIAMYGGVGAAVAVLVIVAGILGFFLYKKKYY